MVDFFTPKAPPVIGVDITPSSIKMVELARVKNTIRLEHYAIEMIADKKIFTDGAVSDGEALIQALKDCHKKLGSKIKGVAIGLPSSMVVSKILMMPSDLTEAELDERVISEMAGHIAFSIDDASVDYKRAARQMPPAPNDGGEVAQTIILASAALRARVDERVAAIEAAGLKALIVDSDMLALIDASEISLGKSLIECNDKTILVIDIGSSLTQFTFFNNEDVVFTRDQAVGGAQLTQDIETHFNVSTEVARKIKMGIEESSDDAIVQGMRAEFVGYMESEARRAVQLFVTSTNFAGVDAVLICGGSASIPGLDAALTQSMGCPVKFLDPFEGMEISKSIDSSKLKREGPSLVTACALAMRRFDK